MKHRILLASDGSENALRAAEFTAGLVKTAPAIKVTVIVVNEMLEKMKYYSPLRSPVIFEEVEIFFKDKTQDALDNTIKIFKDFGIEVEGVVKVGNPAQDVVEYAREKGFAQIVVGSRGMGSLKGIVLGSVSSKIVQLAGCPVTVVK
ncbi:universal stress protein [Pelotomaculum propionicicum]|uniref:Stress response protein NhaX n=1 Tax=Pelotomaculum propionicicum TaxID=258475 RepID=A0A4Y7RKB1_9FIRM|nr:universal stress protein [Pelotomaculum propionicicum]NLI13404.1 universal stress protein [Peptococcaceae bacterium]TEB09438.1 Stress response protein NhaX [Pelotomaculum propionicicum]